jgi:glycosyltransferase involved in cell wall biosynthesis
LIPLAKKFLGSNITFNLAGSLSSNDLDYFNDLKLAFKNLPVDFFPNIGRTELKQLLQKSQVFIHLTGLQVDPEINPEKCEHFGIAPLEAMSCGLVPFVVNNGGPSEYIRDGINGFLFDSIDELYIKLLFYFSLETYERVLLKTNAIKTAGAYNHQIFSFNLRNSVC